MSTYKPNSVQITIDPAAKTPVPNGVFDAASRLLEFSVDGDGEVELADFDLKGIWLPTPAGEPAAAALCIGPDFPFPSTRIIGPGETATLLTFERNRFDIERVYRVTVRPSGGAEYEPEGEHSPPRMVVPRKR